MQNKLAVLVIGNRSAGKTHTWKTLFGRPVKTGNKIRKLPLTESEYTGVFLVSGSPEERDLEVEDIIGDNNPSIVLCSVQYRAEGFDTLRYFVDQGYLIYAHWLNPGWCDADTQEDRFGLANWIGRAGGLLQVRSGKVKAGGRTQEMRSFIHEWASTIGLIRRKPAFAA